MPKKDIQPATDGHDSVIALARHMIQHQSDFYIEGYTQPVTSWPPIFKAVAEVELFFVKRAYLRRHHELE